jgi:aryl-alcohol dehydrogenase-like predicted oxidoreductase
MSNAIRIPAMATDTDFLHRRVPVLGKEVHRLGLALNYGIDADGVRAGIERGIRYFFWTSMRTGKVTPALREALARDRERLVVATGPTAGYFAGNVRRALERALRTLGTDYVDVLHLFWVGVGAAFTDGTVGELVRLKEEGKVRAIGISIHDRERAGRLVADSPIDLFMLRYNAAHPGAEREVFPHLEKRRPAVVAYTATSWRKLLKAPRGWKGRVPTAADCYRFCLSSPHVDVVLTGPKTGAELQENLDGLARGPLAPDEERFMREFGQAVHG